MASTNEYDNQRPQSEQIDPVKAAEKEVTNRIDNTVENEPQQVSSLKDYLRRLVASVKQRATKTEKPTDEKQEKALKTDRRVDMARLFKIVSELYLTSTLKDKIQLQDIDLTPETAGILRAIGDKIGSNHIEESSVDHLYRFINKVLLGEISREQLKTEYRRLRSRIEDTDPELLKYVTEGLIEAARGNYISGVGERQAKIDFDYREESETKDTTGSISRFGDDEPFEQKIRNYGLTERDIQYVMSDYVLAHIDEYVVVDASGQAHLNPAVKRAMLDSAFHLITAYIQRAVSAGLDSSYGSGLSYKDNYFRTNIRDILTRLQTSPSIRNAFDERDPSGTVKNEFIRHMIVVQEFMEDEEHRRQSGHDFVSKLVTNQLTKIDRLEEIAERIPTTQVKSILEGYHGPVVELAAHIVTEYINHKTAIKKQNEYDAALWSASTKNGIDKVFPDYDNLRHVMREMLEELTADEGTPPELRSQFEKALGKSPDQNVPPSNAYIDRAISMGIAITYGTHRALVEQALVKAPQKYIQTPLVDQINFKLKYGAMKAYEIQKSNENVVKEFRRHIRMRIDNQFGGLTKRLRTDGKWSVNPNDGRWKRWVPKEVYNAVVTADRKTGDQIILKWRATSPDPFSATYDDEITMEEAYGDMSRYDVLSIGGQRSAGLKAWIGEQMAKHGVGDDWEEKFRFITAHAGASATWHYDDARVSDEMKKIVEAEFEKSLKKDADKETFRGLTSDEKSLLLDDWLKGKKSKSEFSAGLTAAQYQREKLTASRGANFQRLLERSPENFLYTFARLEPKLSTTIKLANGQTLTAYEYYFDDAHLGKLDSNEKIERACQRNQWKARWTNSAEYLGGTSDKDFSQYANYKHLKKVAEFWHNLYRREYKKEDETGKVSYDVDKAQDDFFNRMASATRRVMVKDKEKMDKTDLIKKMQVGDKFLDDPNDKLGNTISDLLWNDQGLITHFRGVKEKFGITAAEQGQLGEKGFFYWVANRWFNHDFRGGVLPTMNDMKTLPIFEKVGEHYGNSLFVDAVTAVRDWNEALGEIAKLDDYLLQAANKSSFEEAMEVIMGLHAKVHPARGYIGEEIHKIHFFIANQFIRFLMTDWKTRTPWPIRMFMVPAVGKDVSLSVKYKAYKAVQITEEHARVYINTILGKNYILGNPYGMWSREMLWKATGTDRQKYFMLQAGPSILMLLAAFTLFSFFTEGTLKDMGLGGKGK